MRVSELSASVVVPTFVGPIYTDFYASSSRIHSGLLGEIFYGRMTFLMQPLLVHLLRIANRRCNGYFLTCPQTRGGKIENKLLRKHYLNE
jgi:hypothetical protein